MIHKSDQTIKWKTKQQPQNKYLKIIVWFANKSKCNTIAFVQRTFLPIKKEEEKKICWNNRFKSFSSLLPIYFIQGEWEVNSKI